MQYIPIDCDVRHWYIVKFPGLDTEHWGPYVEAELVGMDSNKKITIPLSGEAATEEVAA